VYPHWVEFVGGLGNLEGFFDVFLPQRDHSERQTHIPAVKLWIFPQDLFTNLLMAQMTFDLYKRLDYMLVKIVL
jgi:hypothetical protein